MVNIRNLKCRALLMSTLAAALLAGCGGGDDSAAESQSDYFPLAVGNRWAYDDRRETEIVGQRSAAGKDWYVVRDTPAGGGSAEEALIRSDAQAITSRVESGVAGTLESTVLRMPVVLGDRYPSASYSYTTNDYDGNGINDRVDVRVDLEVVRFETVATPAGTFEGALQLRQTFSATVTYLPAGTSSALSSGVADIWLREGIGLIKSVSSTTAPGSGTQTDTAVLVGYRVGNRTGGTLPPR